MATIGIGTRKVYPGSSSYYLVVSCGVVRCAGVHCVVVAVVPVCRAVLLVFHAKHKYSPTVEQLGVSVFTCLGVRRACVVDLDGLHFGGHSFLITLLV